jgi:type IV pilus assembly protein PilE
MNRLNIKRKRTGAFTIIELMIVLIIIALLVALAYPSFIDYVRKAKRGEAQQLLLNWAINQEIWRSNNPCYETACGSGVSGAEAPTNDHYGFAASDLSATTYTLTANAVGDQQNDTARDGTPCSALTLNENGVKSEPACWE